ELYAVAALVGASIVVAGHMFDWPAAPTTAAGAIACIGLRILAIRRGWRLPVASTGDSPRKGSCGLGGSGSPAPAHPNGGDADSELQRGVSVVRAMARSVVVNRSDRAGAGSQLEELANGWTTLKRVRTELLRDLLVQRLHVQGDIPGVAADAHR